MYLSVMLVNKYTTAALTAICMYLSVMLVNKYTTAALTAICGFIKKAICASVNGRFYATVVT